jgi:hypothetical protein
MMYLLPVYPEMLERLQVEHGIVEGMDDILDNNLNDIVTDSIGLIYAFSMFVSPFIGTYLKEF